MFLLLNGFIVECFIVLGIYGIGGYLGSRMLVLNNGHKQIMCLFKNLHLNGIALWHMHCCNVVFLII